MPQRVKITSNPGVFNNGDFAMIRLNGVKRPVKAAYVSAGLLQTNPVAPKASVKIIRIKGDSWGFDPSQEIPWVSQNVDLEIPYTSVPIQDRPQNPDDRDDIEEIRLTRAVLIGSLGLVDSMYAEGKSIGEIQDQLKVIFTKLYDAV